MANYLSKWRGDEFLDKFEDAFANNMKRATKHLANEVKKELSDPYPPASSPGEPPHRRDGELRRSIADEVDEKKLIGRVGTNKIYGRMLEIGQSRPFLRTTLHKVRKTLRTILGRKTNVKG